MYLTLARLTTLPRRRVRPPTVGTGSYPMTHPNQLTQANSPGCVGRMSSSPAVRQGILTYLSVSVTQTPTHRVKCQNGPVASLQASPATQRHQGGDDQTNPTITTGTAPYMGVRRTKRHHHRHSNLYGSGQMTLSP